MKVLYDGSAEAPDGNYEYYNWQKFDDNNMNLLYVYSIYKKIIPEIYYNYKNRIYFNIEEPNGLYHSSQLLCERDGAKPNVDMFTKFHQLCPYSTDWMLNVHKDNRFEWMKFLPVWDDIYFPNPNEKKIYDVFYMGSLYGYLMQQNEISCGIDVITKYNYIWTSQQIDPADSRRTHIRIPFLEKVKLQSQSKIAIEYSTLYEGYPGQFCEHITKLPQWKENEAFSHIKEGIMPQFKPRIYENMMCKTLILQKRNPWNLMEKFGLEEGVHFLYFDSEMYTTPTGLKCNSNLKETIDACLSDWDYCQKIVDNAYEYAMKYCTINALYKRYFEPYDK
jgi:hypothetical protein